DDRTELDVFQNHVPKSLRPHVGNDLRRDPAAALHHTHDDRLAWRTTTALAPRAATADVCLIHFNVAGQQTANISLFHQGADLLADPVSRFVGHAKLALWLFAAHPMPRRAEQVDRIGSSRG